MAPCVLQTIKYGRLHLRFLRLSLSFIITSLMGALSGLASVDQAWAGVFVSRDVNEAIEDHACLKELHDIKKAINEHQKTGVFVKSISYYLEDGSLALRPKGGSPLVFPVPGRAGSIGYGLGLIKPFRHPSFYQKEGYLFFNDKPGLAFAERIFLKCGTVGKVGFFIGDEDYFYEWVLMPQGKVLPVKCVSSGEERRDGLRWDERICY